MSHFEEYTLGKEDFEDLFSKYYSMLCVIAYDYVKDKSLSEEMVQETFLTIWEKRNSIVMTPAIKYFLIKSTQNTCLQFLRKKKIETQTIHTVSTEKLIHWSDDYPLGRLFEKEIADIVEYTVKTLPPQVKKVFLLSRHKDMTYSQIADQLNISENTVKTQIKIALSRLRTALKEFL